MGNGFGPWPGQPPGGGSVGLPFSLVGDYYTFLINTHGQESILQTTPTTGGDFFSTPAVTLARAFTLDDPVPALLEDLQTLHVTPGANFSHGGTRRQFTTTSNLGSRVWWKEDHNQKTPFTPFYYFPGFVSVGESITDVEDLMFNRFEQETHWQHNSDGAHWQQTIYPDATARRLQAVQRSMTGSFFGEPPVGSVMRIAITGPASTIDNGVPLVGYDGTLIAKNFGAGQGEGSGALWAASLASGPEAAILWSSTLVYVPVDLTVDGILTGGAIDASGATLGSIDVTGSAGIGGALNGASDIGCGGTLTAHHDAVVEENLTVTGNVSAATFNGQPFPAVDFRQEELNNAAAICNFAGVPSVWYDNGFASSVTTNGSFNSFFGTGSTGQAANTVGGVVDLDTLAVANSAAIVYQTFWTAMRGMDGTRGAYISARARLKTAVAAGTLVQIAAVGNQAGNDSIWLGVDGGRSTGFFASGRGNAVGSTEGATSTVAIDTNWHRFRLWTIRGGTLVFLQVDNETPVSFSSTIANDLSPFVAVTTGNGVTRGMQYDDLILVMDAN